MRNYDFFQHAKKCPSVAICPVGALKQEGNTAPIVLDNCIKCGKCVNFCPKKALVLM